MNPDTLVRRNLKTLALAVESLSNTKNSYREVISELASVKGRVIFLGIGKSGHVGKKLASTFTSTGTPSFFVHATEASHGDMGIISADDIVFILSASGETQELRDACLYCQSLDIPIISITKNPSSYLALKSKYCIQIPDIAEVCPNGLAPTTSTLMQLAVGDALASVLSELKGFTASQFRIFHPGGKLGSMLSDVKDIMATGNSLPLVNISTLFKDAILQITDKGFGCCGVINDNGVLCGIYTDGDLRRDINNLGAMMSTPIEMHMNKNVFMIKNGSKAIDVFQFLGLKQISNVFVVDLAHRPVGLVHIKMFAEN